MWTVRVWVVVDSSYVAADHNVYACIGTTARSSVSAQMIQTLNACLVRNQLTHPVLGSVGP